ncbi:MAG: MOSC domain-containing protein, partial [Ignavibacteriales bacterium]|nr:MOSC domain-containing protein [Ignavibacteriales bacterium]
RPNIVVRGCRPFGEDSWKSFRVSSITFHAAKPCSRCVTTTVDQATGMRGKEPLATLSRYRNQDGKVLFGQNLVHEGTGMIRVGDSIEVFANLTTR